MVAKFSRVYAERVHSKNRFSERFNIDLTDEKRLNIIKQIQNRHKDKEAVLIKKQTNRVSLYEVVVEEKVVRVVYDKIRKEIVTGF